MEQQHNEIMNGSASSKRAIEPWSADREAGGEFENMKDMMDPVK
jgi:hypothetical protein